MRRDRILLLRVLVGASLGAVGMLLGLGFGVAQIDQSWKDVAAAGIGALIAVGGAAAVALDAALAAKRQQRTDMEQRIKAVKRLLHRLLSEAASLARSETCAQAEREQAWQVARRRALNVLSVWEPLALFSPYDGVGSPDMQARLAEIDSLCRRLDRYERRTPEPELESAVPLLRPLGQMTEGEREHLDNLVGTGNEIAVACALTLQTLGETRSLEELLRPVVPHP